MAAVVEARAPYRSRDYAATLGHLGDAVEMVAAATWAVSRPIPGTVWRDVCGTYPVLSCGSWAGLVEDLAQDTRHVSFVGVTDPLDRPDPDVLASVFPDHRRPWKDHHVVDLQGDVAGVRSAHHRRNVRRADVSVHPVDDVSAMEQGWCALYDGLRVRHAIGGPADFPASALAAQLHLPGTRVWAARRRDRLVAAVVVFVHDHRAWYHLGAADEVGYAHGAMFALFDRLIRDLADDGVEVLDLGAGAGTDPTRASSGLDRFKSGWSSRTLPTWLVGRVLDPERYRSLCERGTTDWFPAYRGGVR